MYATDPSNALRWYENIRAVECRPERPALVGTRVAFVAGFLGRELAYTYEFVELVPGERVVMRTEQGPFRMESADAPAALDPDDAAQPRRARGGEQCAQQRAVGGRTPGDPSPEHLAFVAGARVTFADTESRRWRRVGATVERL